MATSPIEPRFTPLTVPDAIHLAQRLDPLYEELLAEFNTLVSTHPDAVIKPLLNALGQFRQLRKNLTKTNNALVKLERAQQQRLRLASPVERLPEFSYRVQTTSGTVLVDDTTEERALAKIYEFGPQHTVLSRRPVTSTRVQDWEFIEMIPLGPQK